MKKGLPITQLKKAIKTYYSTNFWKRCKVKETQDRHRFIVSCFAHYIRKLKEPMHIYNLLNFPPFKSFVPDLKLIHNLDEMKRKVIYLLWIFLSTTPVHYIKIEGCTEVAWYKIKDRSQYIYIIGENHNYKGNVLSILKDFSSSLKCPIHVIVEKSYDSFWDLGIASYYKANSTSFYQPPLNTCTKKGAIPNTETLFLPENKEYLENCVAPYKGRVKIWAIDVRRTSIFHLIYIPWNTCVYSLTENFVLDKIKKDNSWKNWFERTKGILYDIFNFSLARNNLVKYDQAIMESLYKYYRAIPKDAPETIQKTKEQLDDIISGILLTKDKSHLDFVKSILHFPPDVVSKWREIVIKEIEKKVFSVLFCIGIHDLYAMIRIARILKKQKEGILLFFGGFTHSKNLRLFLKESGFLGAHNIIMVREKTPKHQVILPIPGFPCSEKTQMMKVI